MSFQVDAVYENGTLKLDHALPLTERERVTVFIKTKMSRVRQSAGLVPWQGAAQALEYLLGPDNVPGAHE